MVNDQVDALLQILRQLPPVCPLGGLRHPHSDMEQRWATVCVCIMEWHAEDCDKSARCEARRELVDVLLHNLWAALFRITGSRDTFCPDEEEKEQWKCHIADAASNRTSVRKRLELAEAGEWKKLLSELLLDASEALSERVRRGGDAQREQSPEDGTRLLVKSS